MRTSGSAGIRGTRRAGEEGAPRPRNRAQEASILLVLSGRGRWPGSSSFFATAPSFAGAVLQRLGAEGRKKSEANGHAAAGEAGEKSEVGGQRSGKGEKNGNGSALGAQNSALSTAINLDDAYLSGVLQDLVGQSAGNV